MIDRPRALVRLQQHRVRRYRKLAAEAAAIAPSWHARTRRRRQVRVLTVLLVLFASSSLLLPFGWGAAYMVWGLTVPALLVLSIPLDRVMGGQIWAPAEILDAAQLEQRNHARSIGFSLVVKLSIIPVLWLYFAPDLHGPDLEDVIRGCALMLVSLLTVGAYSPTLILAWNRPDPAPVGVPGPAPIV
ncbi:hypothetical protein [Nocardia sp. NPDC050717]|uniref:hypothetical protein n=1 Tax=Nocardia sp. NPDC050717 TaxID=3157221 RepID=UPI0033CA5C7F